MYCRWENLWCKILLFFPKQWKFTAHIILEQKQARNFFTHGLLIVSEWRWLFFSTLSRQMGLLRSLLLAILSLATCISMVNRIVSEAMSSDKCVLYYKYRPEERCQIHQYACNHGVKGAARFYSRRFHRFLKRSWLTHNKSLFFDTLHYKLVIHDLEHKKLTPHISPTKTSKSTVPAAVYRIPLIICRSKFSRISQIWSHSRNHLSENFDTMILAY